MAQTGYNAHPFDEFEGSIDENNTLGYPAHPHILDVGGFLDELIPYTLAAHAEAVKAQKAAYKDPGDEGAPNKRAQIEKDNARADQKVNYLWRAYNCIKQPVILNLWDEHLAWQSIGDNIAKLIENPPAPSRRPLPGRLQGEESLKFERLALAFCRGEHITKSEVASSVYLRQEVAKHGRSLAEDSPMTPFLSAPYYLEGYWAFNSDLSTSDIGWKWARGAIEIQFRRIIQAGIDYLVSMHPAASNDVAEMIAHHTIPDSRQAHPEPPKLQEVAA